MMALLRPLVIVTADPESQLIAGKPWSVLVQDFGMARGASTARNASSKDSAIHLFLQLVGPSLPGRSKLQLSMNSWVPKKWP
jgi:hypothetical protein